jgi:hypothetical protein
VNGSKGLSVNDFYSGLESSGWLRHIKAVLDAAIFLAKVTISRWFRFVMVGEGMDLALVSLGSAQTTFFVLCLFNGVHISLKWYLRWRLTVPNHLQTTFLFACFVFAVCFSFAIATVLLRARSSL